MASWRKLSPLQRVGVAGALAAVAIPLARVLEAPASTPKPPLSSTHDSTPHPGDGMESGRVVVTVPRQPGSATDETPVTGNLSWGRDPTTGKPWTPEALRAAAEKNPELNKAFQGFIKRARAELGQKLVASKVAHYEGTLPNDPVRETMTQAMKQISMVYDLSFAARFGPPDLQRPAGLKAAQALALWAKTYRPTGNPIDELNFIPMFEAVDLARPYLTPAQHGAVDAWLHRFIKAGDSFDLRGTESFNNWDVWRLAIRGIAAQALGDKTEIARTRDQLGTESRRDINDDGSTYDFHERDAFHYHLYSLRAFELVAAFAPDTVTPAIRARIESAARFVAPYFEGKRTHVEFKNSRVGFDRARQQAGDADYAPHVWDPKDAADELRLAAALFPAERGWTKAADAMKVDPRTVVTQTLLWK